jgi:hypothetical protein
VAHFEFRASFFIFFIFVSGLRVEVLYYGIGGFKEWKALRDRAWQG